MSSPKQALDTHRRADLAWLGAIAADLELQGTQVAAWWALTAHRRADSYRIDPTGR